MILLIGCHRRQGYGGDGALGVLLRVYYHCVERDGEQALGVARSGAGPAFGVVRDLEHVGVGIVGEPLGVGRRNESLCAVNLYLLVAAVDRHQGVVDAQL